MAVDYAGLEILDIRNPGSVRQLGWWNPWRAGSLSNIWFNSAGHTNQIGYDAVRRLVRPVCGRQRTAGRQRVRPFRLRPVADYGATKNSRGAWGMTLGDEAGYLQLYPGRRPVPKQLVRPRRRRARPIEIEPAAKGPRRLPPVRTKWEVGAPAACRNSPDQRSVEKRAGARRPRRSAMAESSRISIGSNVLAVARYIQSTRNSEAHAGGGRFSGASSPQRRRDLSAPSFPPDDWVASYFPSTENARRTLPGAPPKPS